MNTESLSQSALIPERKVVPLPAKPRAVANTILELVKKKDTEEITPMKMQKLIYFAHGWYLAFTGNPLVSEEIQAWDYGPVIETLYHDLKNLGFEPIKEPITDISYHSGEFSTSAPVLEDEKACDVLAQTIDIYGKYTAIQLSNLTHMPDTPWSNVVSRFPDEIKMRSLPIPNELIRDHFQNELVKRK